MARAAAEPSGPVAIAVERPAPSRDDPRRRDPAGADLHPHRASPPVTAQEMFMLRPLVVALVAAAPIHAQTLIYPGGADVAWDADCNGSKTFKNQTARPICDFRLEKLSGTNALIQIHRVKVEDGVGPWVVDDNADGT